MASLVTPEIESLTPYEAGKPIEEVARELGLSDIIKLASNENPLGPSPRAMQAVRAALSEGHRYPDAAAFRLRERLAAFHGVEMDEVIQGNGSNEILELLIRTFTTRDDHVVFAEPAFVVYKLASLAHGVPFTAVPTKDWTHDLPAMAAAVRPNTKLMFIANPNNPTGTHVGREALSNLLQELPPEVIVVLDEAYIQYVSAEDYADGLTLRGLRERLVLTRTFSKIYGLASLRVGYAIGPKALINYMNRVRAPFNVGSLGQAAAIAALEDAEHVERSVRENAQERARLLAALPEFGFETAPSQCNFVFCGVKRPARELFNALLQRGVIIRPVGPEHVRITVGTPRENDRLLSALKEELGGRP
ncbi:MAG: histidinol-phosphate transaminase [Polyangiaceae bacterium]